MSRRWRIGIVIAVCALAILLAGLPAFFFHLDDTPATATHKAQMDLASLAELVEEFHSRNNRYPRNDEGLAAVVRFGSSMNQAPERWPIDPWGRPYVYRVRTDGLPELYSLGPNGIDEHARGDDIAVPTR
jgi:hypothetical protein